MYLRIFDVEHGQCSLLATRENGHMLIDCGHNSTTGWRPSEHLPQIGVRSIDRLFITNSDEDHASDLENVRKAISIGSLSRNPTVTSSNIRQLKSQSVGNGIKALCEMLDLYTQPAQPNFSIDSIPIKSFYHSYPADFEDENNLSVVSFFDLGNVRFCFTGDMTAVGFRKMLERPDFKRELAKTTVFIASHHGREDGCCDELYSVGGLRPTVTIISDSGLQHATQETVSWYANRTVGFELNGRYRRVLTTRTDGTIHFACNPSGSAEVYVGV